MSPDCKSDNASVLLSQSRPTLCPQVLRPLRIVHRLQRLRLFPYKRLLVIVLPRSAQPIEYDPPSVRIAEKVEGEKDQRHESRRAKGRQHPNEDALARRAISVVDVDDYVGIRSLIRWPLIPRPVGLG